MSNPQASSRLGSEGIAAGRDWPALTTGFNVEPESAPSSCCDPAHKGVYPQLGAVEGLIRTSEVYSPAFMLQPVAWCKPMISIEVTIGREVMTGRLLQASGTPRGLTE